MSSGGQKKPSQNSIRDNLEVIYDGDTEAISAWYIMPNPLLDDKTPVSLIARGEWVQVLTVVQAMRATV
jgi:uncharacterized protein (DUF2384 family)